MNPVENIASEPSSAQAENTISMPMGLLGFERIKEYLLLADPAEEPFLWLQVSREENLAFLVVAPQPLVPSYKPEISPEDVAFLGLTSADDAALLSIVTVRGPNQVTPQSQRPHRSEPLHAGGQASHSGQRG